MAIRREGVTLFHEPHYMLPPLVRCKSVVTIHDCIHLMFPQYLPNRLSLAYARTSITLAARQRDAGPDRVGELQARHPAVCRRAPGEDRRDLQLVRRAIRRRAAAKKKSSASANATSSTIRSCCMPAT